MAQRAAQSPPVLLIAETRPPVAWGLKAFLADIPGTRPVAIMTGFDHVVEFAEHHEVGLIIVGKGMHGATPLSEFRRLREINPTWRLALLADVADRDTMMAGLSEGAGGIIPTSVDERELQFAITRILAGNTFIPNSTTVLQPQHRAWPDSVTMSPPQISLTPRQLEVLGVLAQGKSNKQIAQILAISLSTVSMHLNTAFHALGVHDRASAASAFNNMKRRDHEAIHDWSSEIIQSVSSMNCSDSSA